MIDALPVFQRVLESPVAREVASGTLKVGVRSLALTAVDLRRPLGAKRPFVSLADFKRAKINVIPSAISEDTMRALGATPLEVGGNLSDDLKNGSLAGAETAIDVAYENGFSDVAHYITSNVVFYPKPLTIDINSSVFGRLTATQRAVLDSAAAATARESIVLLDWQQNVDALAICKSGIRFAQATPTELAALENAVSPVYAKLARDPLTAKVIAAIQAIKKHTPSGNALSSLCTAAWPEADPLDATEHQPNRFTLPEAPRRPLEFAVLACREGLKGTGRGLGATLGRLS